MLSVETHILHHYFMMLFLGLDIFKLVKTPDKTSMSSLQQDTPQ